MPSGRNSATDVDAEATARQQRRAVAGYAAGFAFILLAAGLFALIAVHIGPGYSLGLADQALTDAIAAHVPRSALRVFGVLTHFGDPMVLVTLAVLVATGLSRLRERALVLGWLMSLAGNAVLNPALKQIFERARPLHDHGLAYATGYSFPSGHSSGAMVAYGMLAYVAFRLLPPRWHAAIVIVAALLIVTTASSRVFLQVHFASDVAAGLLSGAAWLGVCIASLEFARRRRRGG